jgi:dynamin 1-like protein
MLVHEELKKIIYQVKLSELRRFSHLESNIKSIVEKLLAKLVVPTNEMIKNLFEVERGYINTRHPDFILAARDSIHGNPNSDDEKEEIVSKKSSATAPAGKGQGSKTAQTTGGNILTSFAGAAQSQVGGLPTPGQDTPLQAPTPGPFSSGAPISQPTAFTGITPLQHLSRIPDRLMIETKPSKRERNEISLIKQMITSYFDVVKKNVNDLVPKTIITFFIKRTIDLAEKEMVHCLYDDKVIEAVMKEDQDVVNQRNTIMTNISVLKECLVLMAEFEHSH